MAQTPNLKLNLFNGNDKPNYELFNDNNMKIDEVLNNAKTHNHDGVNSSNIKATSVTFNSGDTTLSSNNLEDAVKEVFTEADNKITWITNAIGKTSNNQSNPDIKADEIKADFDTAREKYLENVKNYTLFNMNGYFVNSTSSINDIAEAISNTTFKEATATKDDMLVTSHGITKSGIIEYGTIEPIDYLMVKPDTYKDQTISKGMYKQLFLPAFPEENPALFIRKGCSILGVNGILSEHGSNGWDVGDNILKTKLDIINTNSVYSKQLGAGAGIYSSLSHKMTLKKDNATYIDVQHFRLVNGKIECYTPDMKEYYTVSFADLDLDITRSGSVQKNYITSKRMFKVFEQYGCLYAAIAYEKRVYIVELLSRKIAYKYPASNSSNLNMIISEILIPNKYSGQVYNICFIGEDGYITCKPIYNSSGTEIEKWNGYKMHGFNFVYTKESTGTVTLTPKVTKTEEQSSSYPTTVVKARNMFLDVNNPVVGNVTNNIVLGVGDKISVLNYLSRNSTIELVYSIPFGGSAATIQLFDDNDSLVEQIQTSSTATTVKTITIGNSADLTISCTSGKINIKGIKVAEEGYSDTRNKLFSNDWGFLGGRSILNTVEITGTEDEVYLLWGGHEKKLEEGKCDAIYSVTKFNALSDIDSPSFFDLGEKLIVEDMYIGKDTGFNETTKTNKCLGFMSEYDNYIYGTFPDMRYIHSTVSATGTRYHKYNRRLIKLNIGKYNHRAKATLTESTKAFEYRLVRPMFINHLGQVIGLEQSCALERFTYFVKLNNKLQGSQCYEEWSEDEYRTAEEEFKILDDGNAVNKIRMLESVVRLYGTDGNVSNTKLIGITLTASTESAKSTQASMSSDYKDTSAIYTAEHGLLSIYNPVYKINSLNY